MSERSIIVSERVTWCLGNSRNYLKTISIENGRPSESGVGRAMRNVERSDRREFNLPEGRWLTLASSFLSSVVRAALPSGRGSGGTPSERRGEPLSDERASRRRLLSEGAFSEAGTHRVQAPSRRRSVRAVHAALSSRGATAAARRFLFLVDEFEMGSSLLVRRTRQTR